MAHRPKSRATFRPARRIRCFRRSISQQSLATISYFAIPTRYHQRRTTELGGNVRCGARAAFPMRGTKGGAHRDHEPALQAFKCVLVAEQLISTDITGSEPGGYLQWVEYDPISFRVVSPNPSLKQSANEKHVQIIRGPDGNATELVSHLVSLTSSTIPTH